MGAIAAAAWLAASPAGAGILEVAPTTIVLGHDAKAAVLYINNDGDMPVTVQIEPFDWAQSDGRDRLTPSDVLMASPPIAAIPAQGKQTVRLMAKPDADSGERSFRLLVSELPDPARQHDRTIQVLTQFSVPVFTGAAAGGSAKVLWDAVLGNGELAITARNQGAQHAKLANLQIVCPTDTEPLADKELNYILAGTTRSWKGRCARCGVGDAIRIKGDDQAADAKFDETLVIRR